MGAALVTLGELARIFAGAPLKFEAAAHLELKRVALKVRDDATKKFGTYQPAVDDLPAWASLRPATVAAKMKAGSPGDDPLIGHYSRNPRKRKKASYKKAVSAFRAGGKWPMPLRSSISTHVESLTAQIGTDNPLAKWHEYGTTKGNYLPPRPFLRPAAFENQKYFRERMLIAWEAAIRSLP